MSKRPLQPPRYWRAEIIITDQPAVGDAYADADFVQEKLVELTENELYLGFDFKISTPKQVVPKYDAQGNAVQEKKTIPVPAASPTIEEKLQQAMKQAGVTAGISHEKALALAKELNAAIQSKAGLTYPHNCTGVREMAKIIHTTLNRSNT